MQNNQQWDTAIKFSLPPHPSWQRTEAKKLLYIIVSWQHEIIWWQHEVLERVKHNVCSFQICNFQNTNKMRVTVSLINTMCRMTNVLQFHFSLKFAYWDSHSRLTYFQHSFNRFFKCSIQDNNLMWQVFSSLASWQIT